ncbi:hypothetical protein P12x_003392 [Tundrisphaera lichenicola]|uniref:hypothetical protein n=1 Tax=Tundrisphaera lichenicola TaxID=2029860 RepID=UPI003EB8F377
MLREPAGIDDSLLFRTLAVLPFLRQPGLDPSARAMFQESGVQPYLGWTPAQIQSGDNQRCRFN